jgi:hypothetical protein
MLEQPEAKFSPSPQPGADISARNALSHEASSSRQILNSSGFTLYENAKGKSDAKPDPRQTENLELKQSGAPDPKQDEKLDPKQHEKTDSKQSVKPDPKSSENQEPMRDMHANSQSDLVEAHGAPGRWTLDHASQWHKDAGWLVGSNFVPANAINQLEMWQKDTFDKKEIDRELGWAEGLGMNRMRVFLHDLLWQQDPEGFKQRINDFLTIADKHHIKPDFVLFDSCWDPNPELGPQHEPVPGVHNSGWVQSPGKDGLTDPNQEQRLEGYVKGVVGAFANDPRVLMWDVWNEPDNMNDASYRQEEPWNKVSLVQNMLPEVFQWARSVHPTQPLTSGVWLGDWSSFNRLNQMQKTQLENSDIITFHNYGNPQDFANRVHQLSQYDRPLICSEYMARPMGSTFDPILQIAKDN